MAEEQYGQYASPDQQGFYQSEFTLDDQPDPSQQQQQWSQGPSSYYSAPPPQQQHVYSAEGYGQQSKLLLDSKLHVYIANYKTSCVGWWALFGSIVGLYTRRWFVLYMQLVIVSKHLCRFSCEGANILTDKSEFVTASSYRCLAVASVGQIM